LTRCLERGSIAVKRAETTSLDRAIRYPVARASAKNDYAPRLLVAGTLKTSYASIVAALIESNGNVSEAARAAGVSKQYVYEVLGRLRSLGYKFRGFPSLAALGRVFLAISRGRGLPENGTAVMLLKVYSFKSEELSVGVYVVPLGTRAAWLLQGLSGAEVSELLDLVPAAPHYDIADLRLREGERLPRPPRRDLDDIDKAILAKLYEDFSHPVSASVPGVSKSLASYHYRRHVKPLLRLLLDTHPLLMHARPLLMAEIFAASEEWMATLLKARQVYLLMPKRDPLSAYALLEVEDPYAFLKSVVEARRGRGLGIQVNLHGYVDPERSEKPKIPRVFLPAHHEEVSS